MSIYSNISLIVDLNFSRVIRHCQLTTADIRYISPSDKRGAGSWVSHQLDKYADGTKVRFIVK